MIFALSINSRTLSYTVNFFKVNSFNVNFFKVNFFKVNFFKVNFFKASVVPRQTNLQIMPFTRLNLRNGYA